MLNKNLQFKFNSNQTHSTIQIPNMFGFEDPHFNAIRITNVTTNFNYLGHRSANLSVSIRHFRQKLNENDQC